MTGGPAGHRPEGPAPTGPVVGDRDRGDPELPDEAQPKGAIMVTTIVAIAILVFFFGVLSILMGRG
ncbi:MAG TPA: cytochrome c oxidase subunit 2A [Trueperaceae bacterium]|nr:cytochrome c oxidase subunit 2A [Trueperaceae bacterium]